MDNEQNFTSPDPAAMQEEAGTMPGRPKSLMDKEELTGFYKKSLPRIIKTIFLQPVNGTYSLFTERSEKTYFNALVLIASTAILYIIIPYLLMGSDLRSMVGFSVMFKLGITAIVFMLLVSVLSFGIKSVGGGKPVFKNELFTGGLCGIPLTLLLVLMIIARIFMGNGENAFGFMMDPYSMLRKLGLLLLLVFYVLLMLINILQQSLRAGGTRDALSWYLAPVSIIVAFYLTEKIAQGFF